ncbi:MAG TPA: hypothetical protein VMS88_01445, partial [Terriglobales bacterium]|nr:hypothetical protein [Terriglobales bacterium]
MTLLRGEQARDPHSAQLERELGIALFKSGDAAAALTELYVARQIQPRNRATLYFLGCAADLAGDSALALEAYRACLAVGGTGLGPVRARATALQTAVLKQEMALALAREPRIKLDDVPLNAVAVPEFALMGEADSLRPICRGLAAILLVDLRKVPQLRVVDPERLPLLLELRADRWGSPGGNGLFAVSSASAPRLGLLLGARQFIQGEV